MVAPKKGQLSARSLTLQAIQTHPKDTFKIKEIFEQVSAENPATKPLTVTNTICTDFTRLGLVSRLNPGSGPTRGGVEYELTEMGKSQDFRKIPSVSRGIKAVKKQQGKEVPKGVTDASQVVKNQDGSFGKLEGNIDAVTLADTFIEYVSFLKAKIQKMADKISAMQSEHKKDLDAIGLEIKRKDSKILEQDKLIGKLRKLKTVKDQTFNLGELAQFRSSKNKS